MSPLFLLIPDQSLPIEMTLIRCNSRGTFVKTSFSKILLAKDDAVANFHIFFNGRFGWCGRRKIGVWIALFSRGEPFA